MLTQCFNECAACYCRFSLALSNTVAAMGKDLQAAFGKAIKQEATLDPKTEAARATYSIN